MPAGFYEEWFTTKMKQGHDSGVKYELSRSELIRRYFWVDSKGL